MYAWRDSYNFANMVMQNGYKKFVSQFLMKCPLDVCMYACGKKKKTKRINRVSVKPTKPINQIHAVAPFNFITPYGRDFYPKQVFESQPSGDYGSTLELGYFHS